MGDIDVVNDAWPKNMVVFGDSVATGFLGGSRMGDDVPDEYIKFLAGSLSIPGGMQINPRALGETEKTRYSPFTGKLILGSLENRFATIESGFSAFNAAVPGASSWDIAAQINAAQQKNQAFEFTVMEFGHNDFCNPSGSLEIFKTFYAKNMTQVLGANPQAKILLVPLINIPRLYEVAPDSANATRLPFSFQLVQANCKKMREDIENACPTFKTRASNFSQWADVIPQTAATFQQNFPQARIVVAETLNNPQLIVPQNISLDCFHPSKWGYQQMASAMWQSIQTSKIFRR